MFKCFYPGRYYDSAYDIEYGEFYEKGYRGIIFDVDNTLVEHGAPVTKRAKDLFPPEGKPMKQADNFC